MKKNPDPRWDELYRLQEAYKTIIEEPIVPQYVVYDIIRSQNPDDTSMDV